jgi:hypothetical protein
MNDEQFLMAVRSYIERSEVELDDHLGSHRKLKALIDAGRMPPVYAEVLKRLQAPSPLVEWLNCEFKHACGYDVMRLRESLLMIQAGMERGDPPEKIMGIAIASFVQGLIDKRRPLTAPVEGN